ncbi:NfeD family protein [Virgibacillus halodenitrificans]|uniref:NfeD family protein n=1 Tax=Virgibacillus halodenitrificans TaxID=1482 RepID=UPI002DB932D4|nr:nodulation protein NfeD [Virgibacillus halodenitrificans]MEC2160054.1 nodulation protein NfeD [Virgibacillus halodenitrificans]
MVRYILFTFIVLLLFCTENGIPVKAAEDGSGKSVYFIPIEREVERGLEAFLSRTTEEAIENGADHIVFEIDTPGGRVDSAGQIAKLLQDLNIPTTSFIVNQALSAGSYIALNTDNIYMKPQATMGASGVINSDGTAADKKAQSAWLAAMKSAAESKGRDPIYAAAMADSSIDLPEYDAGKGKFLTLGPTEAVKVNYAKAVVDDRVELLHELGLSNAAVVEKEPTFSEEVARFLTNPVVIPILLSVASLGLIVELYSPGFGVPGTMGLVALVLFFYGHIVAGLAGMEAIILLILGIALIIAEFFLPGGIAGLLGIGAIIGSLLMSGYDLGHMAMSISIAFLVTLIVSIILFRRIGMDKGVFRHIILKEQTTTELGYVSSVNRLELIGLEGRTVTPLRPSGTAVFDNERLDVISEGGYIDANRNIKVIKVEGVRIVVREI